MSSENINQLILWIDKYIGTTYKIKRSIPNPEGQTELVTKLELDWWNLLAILVSIIFLITAWIMLVSIVRNMDMIIEIGNRSQEECGKTYMEYETARYKLYTEYNDKIGKSLKTVNSLLITIIGLAFALTIINMVVNWYGIRKNVDCSINENVSIDNPKYVKISFLVAVVGVSLLIIFSTYVQQNTQLKFENKYNDAMKKIPFAGSMSTTTLLIFAFAGAFAVIIYTNGELNKAQYLPQTSTSVWLWIILLPVVFIFIYLMNINTIKINNDFVVPYGSATSEINKNLNILRTLDCSQCIIEEGANKDMKIQKWINLMLARNIKRVHSEEENGDPQLLLDDTNVNATNEYIRTLYAYIENALGKELSELPENVVEANTRRTEIRKQLRYIRHKNDSMLKPVKSFVIQIATITALIVGILAFILFHLAYKSYATATTIVVTIISVLFIAILLAVYSWNTGRSLYV